MMVSACPGASTTAYKIRLGSGVVHTFLTQGLSSAAGILLTLVTARVLGPAGQGTVVLALLVARVVEMVANLGLGHALMQQRARGRFAAAELIGAAYHSWAGLSLVMIGASALLMPWSARWLPADLPVSVAWLVPAISSCRLLHYFTSSLLLGAGRLRLFNWLSLLETATAATLCLALGFAGRLSVSTMLGGHLAGALAAALAASSYAGWRCHRPPWALLASCLRYGTQLQLGQIALFLTYRLDAFLVGLFLSVRDLGFYAAAVALTEVLWRLPNAISTVLYPLVAGTSSADADVTTRRVCQMTVPVMTLAAAGIGLGAGPLVEWLFGSAYAAAVLPTLLLLPGVVTLTLFKLLYHDLAARGQPDTGLAATLAGLVATIALDLTLIPRFGLAGAALASTFAYSVAAAWVVVAFVRRARCRPAELLWPDQSARQTLRRVLETWRSRLLRLVTWRPRRWPVWSRRRPQDRQLRRPEDDRLQWPALGRRAQSPRRLSAAICWRFRSAVRWSGHWPWRWSVLWSWQGSVRWVVERTPPPPPEG